MLTRLQKYQTKHHSTMSAIVMHGADTGAIFKLLEHEVLFTNRYFSYSLSFLNWNVKGGMKSKSYIWLSLQQATNVRLEENSCVKCQ